MKTAMTHDTMMMYLTRRADHLAKRVAEAEAVGRTLTWDKGELLALQAAMGKLEKRQLEMDANDTDAAVCNKSALLEDSLKEGLHRGQGKGSPGVPGGDRPQGR
jgi:hypothetical protein